MAHYLATRDPRFAAYTIKRIDEKEVADSKRGFPQPPVTVCNGEAVKTERGIGAGKAERRKRRRSN
jgi:hypothetical protein